MLLRRPLLRQVTRLVSNSTAVPRFTPQFAPRLQPPPPPPRLSLRTMASEARTPDPASTAATSVAGSETGKPEYEPRYIDVGINLTDPTFTGIYHGKKSHEDDLAEVIARSQRAGCKALMVTGSDLRNSREAIALHTLHPSLVFATVGVHPCSAGQFESTSEHHVPTRADDYLAALRTLALEGRAAGAVVAFGEIGLDYDRLFLCPADVQRRYFAAQLDVAEEVGLPLFLHSRAAAADFRDMLFPRLARLKGGLVHSFTGTVEEMRELVGAGLFVGVNGCSLKTRENLDVVREIPLDRLMLETDGPWCEIRPSHESAKLLKEAGKRVDAGEAKKKEKFEMGKMVKGRNESAAIGLVAEVVALVKGCSVEEVVEAAWANSVGLFGFGMREGESAAKGGEERGKSEVERVEKMMEKAMGTGDSLKGKNIAVGEVRD